MRTTIKTLSSETAVMIAIACGAMVGGLVEWIVVIKVVSYLLS